MTIINLIVGAFFNANDFEWRFVASVVFDTFIMALITLALTLK